MPNRTNGGFLISQIKQVQGRVFTRLLQAHGIREVNGAQGRILFVLWRESPLPITELARRTGLAKTTLTGMLGRLERAGMIRRTAVAADRRMAGIALSDAAEALRGDYEAVSRHMETLFYRGFTQAEIETLEAGLARVLHNLTEEET